MNSINKYRIAWIDNIKMFAMLSVMIGHCSATFFMGEPYKDEVHTFMIAYSMPLFIFISGFTSFKGISKITSLQDLIAYWQKLAMRIAIPSIFYTCVDIIIRFCNSIVSLERMMVAIAVLISISILVCLHKRQVFAPTVMYLSLGILLIHSCFNVFASLWFFPFLLRVLIVSSMSFLVCNRLRFRPFVCFLVIYLIMAIWKFSWDVNIELISYFLLGMLMNKEKALSVLVYKKYVAITFLMIAFVCTCIIHGKSFYENPFIELLALGEFHIFLFRQVAGIMWCLFFVSLFSLYSSNYGYFSYLGSKTLSIYGIHVIIINILSGGENQKQLICLYGVKS